MEENDNGQQHLITNQGSLSQSCGDDMSLHGSNVQISDRLENIENLASSFQESTRGPERMRNRSDSRPNLLLDVQNSTASPCRSPQSPRNPDNLFIPRGYRNSLFGQDSLFERGHIPTSDRLHSPSRPLNQPYQFKGRYMSSPRRRPFQDTPFQDIPTPATPLISYYDRGDNTPKKRDTSAKDGHDSPGKADQKQEKEKKSITTKTFAHGMMDVSLLTSNSTQLRAVLSFPDHEYYTLLLWLIGLSIVLQIISAVLLIMSDYFKTQVKEKDLQNNKKRKLLNFLSLALVSIVTSLNVLISVFATPSQPQQMYQQRFKSDIPVFSSADIIRGHNHTEL